MKKRINIILIIVVVFLLLFSLLAIATMYYFEPVGESDYTIELLKPELQNDIKFNEYLERDEGRKIYLAGNIDEFYFYEIGEKKQTLKEYANTWQSLDDIMKHITSGLDLYGELNDGGTKIYKSKEKDTTIVVCNTVSGNKDIFIGDYDMQFDSHSMCNREIEYKVSLDELKKINDQIVEHYQAYDADYANLAHVYVDEENMVVVIGLLDNSKEQQDNFRKLLGDFKYIRFEKGEYMVLN